MLLLTVISSLTASPHFDEGLGRKAAPGLVTEIMIFLFTDLLRCGRRHPEVGTPAVPLGDGAVSTSTSSHFTVGLYGYIAPSSCWCWFADVLHADVVLAFTVYMAADTLNFVRHPGSRQGVEVTAELSRSLWFSPVWGVFPLGHQVWTQRLDIGTPRVATPGTLEPEQQTQGHRPKERLTESGRAVRRTSFPIRYLQYFFFF